MDSFNKNISYNYFNKLLTKKEIEEICFENNIKNERVELFRDFYTSLCYLINDTYLGDDSMNESDKTNHFKWCWNEVIKNFREIGNDFENEHFFKYLTTFFNEVFYNNDYKNNDDYKKKLINIIENLFDLSIPKTKSDIDSFLEGYIIMDIVLEKNTNRL